MQVWLLLLTLNPRLDLILHASYLYGARESYDACENDEAHSDVGMQSHDRLAFVVGADDGVSLM